MREDVDWSTCKLRIGMDQNGRPRLKRTFQWTVVDWNRKVANSGKKERCELWNPTGHSQLRPPNFILSSPPPHLTFSHLLEFSILLTPPSIHLSYIHLPKKHSQVVAKQKMGASSDPTQDGSDEQQKRSEIYTYEAPWHVYAWTGASAVTRSTV